MVVANFEVVQWIVVVYRRRINDRARKDHDLLPTSYERVASWFAKACSKLGITETFTTHSLRRGGATELLIQQFSLETIMEFGRWASVSFARLYLRRGLAVALPKRCLLILCSVGGRVWVLVKLLE